VNRLAWCISIAFLPMLVAGGAVVAGCGSVASSGTADGGAPDAGYVSCAHTSEPAPASQAPCTQYLGLSGDLTKCGIADASIGGALSVAACQVNCLADVCSLVLDASTVAPGIGSPVIACGCQ
jgi:hypothetical protein